MKYIRTKIGIYTNDNLYTITKNDTDGKFKVGDKVLSTDKIFTKVEDKDIADTIEELCDELIVVWNNWREWHEHCFTFGEIEQIVEDYGLDDYEVYGAIWTDKGLIYVAKMNEKEELELL